MSLAHRLAAYVWAGPNTMLGLGAGLVMLAFGAAASRIHGTLEFSGGAIGLLFASRMQPVRFQAVTFGHVILGTSAAALAGAREHEQAHVRQYERWGPFFLPAYFASSAWQLLTGRHVYHDNYFERQAVESCTRH
ncbi:MAG: hypothetical protein WD793_15010 [Steroidobacteraceae bacterium]